MPFVAYETRLRGLSNSDDMLGISYDNHPHLKPVNSMNELPLDHFESDQYHE